ncbi:hypothetical protein K438DRAFT_1784240 [Mycena galopus ATCC 62051]|nr:hypothetical protein K438DRAFT_1784240 [Mycena galopus ATCC 62051]
MVSTATTLFVIRPKPRQPLTLRAIYMMLSPLATRHSHTHRFTGETSSTVHNICCPAASQDDAPSSSGAARASTPLLQPEWELLQRCVCVRGASGGRWAEDASTWRGRGTCGWEALGWGVGVLEPRAVGLRRALGFTQDRRWSPSASDSRPGLRSSARRSLFASLQAESVVDARARSIGQRSRKPRLPSLVLTWTRRLRANVPPPISAVVARIVLPRAVVPRKSFSPRLGRRHPSPIPTPQPRHVPLGAPGLTSASSARCQCRPSPARCSPSTAHPPPSPHCCGELHDDSPPSAREEVSTLTARSSCPSSRASPFARARSTQVGRRVAASISSHSSAAYPETPHSPVLGPAAYAQRLPSTRGPALLALLTTPIAISAKRPDTDSLPARDEAPLLGAPRAAAASSRFSLRALVLPARERQCEATCEIPLATSFSACPIPDSGAIACPPARVASASATMPCVTPSAAGAYAAGSGSSYGGSQSSSYGYGAGGAGSTAVVSFSRLAHEMSTNIDTNTGPAASYAPSYASHSNTSSLAELSANSNNGGSSTFQPNYSASLTNYPSTSSTHAYTASTSNTSP